jgi:hypothetical protein
MARHGIARARALGRPGRGWFESKHRPTRKRIDEWLQPCSMYRVGLGPPTRAHRPVAEDARPRAR